ncbi:MAG: GNAT family N-acetyltransferase [Alphaproteobacteria bacterium]|nr:GNAT family N-acetyltransferase [Alphaproteobacteria bacterium]
MKSNLYLKQHLRSHVPVYISRVKKQDFKQASFLMTSFTDDVYPHYLIDESLILPVEPESLYLIAEVQSKILATASIEKFSLSKKSAIGFFNCSALFETEVQRETLTILVRALIEWARKTGVVRLETFIPKEKEKALLFFKDFGFEKEEECGHMLYMKEYHKKTDLLSFRLVL